MVTRKVPRPKIGLLALTLELYETLAPNLRGSRENWLRSAVIPALERDSDVLFKQVLFRREDVEAVVAEFEAGEVDVLVVILATYSPSMTALPALKHTRLPILIWNTQEIRTVDGSFTMDQMTNNHGVHGSQDLASVLTRAAVPFHYISSPPDDVDGLAELLDFASAALAVSLLHSTRIGLIGYPFPGMGDFAVDTTHFTATLGCDWKSLSVEDYNVRCAAIPRDNARALASQYRTSYDVAKDITDVELQAAAAAEIALRGMIADHRLNALTYQFLAFGEDDRTETLPFVAASRLMADGIGFGGEGDLVAAAGTAFFNWIKTPSTFSEIFTVDFAGESLFMSHMGEVNVDMARRDRKVSLVARPSPITRTRGRQLALVASLEPGPATFASLAIGPAGKWRIIAAPVQIEDFGPLPEFCVPHFKIKPIGSVRRFLTNYANAGGPHHNGVIFGDARRRLRFAAGLMGADYIEI